MKRIAAVALLLSLSCNFAVKHPAVTAGIVGGTVALGTCELASSDDKKCLITSGAVGVGLALIAAGALWLGGSDDEAEPATSEPPPKVDWDKVPDTTPKEPTKAPPPPPDAGVPAQPTTPPPPPPADAGVPVTPPDGAP